MLDQFARVAQVRRRHALPRRASRAGAEQLSPSASILTARGPCGCWPLIAANPHLVLTEMLPARPGQLADEDGRYCCEFR
jgi:hypothetical protein